MGIHGALIINGRCSIHPHVGPQRADANSAPPNDRIIDRSYGPESKEAMFGFQSTHMKHLPPLSPMNSFKIGPIGLEMMPDNMKDD